MTDLNIKENIIKTGLICRLDSATAKDLKVILKVLVKDSHSPSTVETWFCSPLLVTSGETATCLQVVAERPNVCGFCWKPLKSKPRSAQGNQVGRNLLQ